MTDLKVNDLIRLTHGPFVSTWRVKKVTTAGARLEYQHVVQFVGYEKCQYAPNRTRLTFTGAEEFIGRAHWHSVDKLDPFGEDAVAAAERVLARYAKVSPGVITGRQDLTGFRRRAAQEVEYNAAGLYELDTAVRTLRGSGRRI